MKATDLEWFELQDELYGVPGWTLSVGCTWEQDMGDAPQVRIHEAEINTGQRVIQLHPLDLPNVVELESLVSEMIEDRNERDARYLAGLPV